MKLCNLTLLCTRKLPAKTDPGFLRFIRCICRPANDLNLSTCYSSSLLYPEIATKLSMKLYTITLPPTRKLPVKTDRGWNRLLMLFFYTRSKCRNFQPSLGFTSLTQKPQNMFLVLRTGYALAREKKFTYFRRPINF